MRPTAYSTPAFRTPPIWCAAFAAGCGGRVQEGGPLRPGPVAMFGSPGLWPILRQAQAAGRDWFYGDHAYFGRFRFYRITRGAYQHDGRGDAGAGRFEALGLTIRPWRRGGRHVLICPPDPVFAGLMGLDADRWLAEIRAELARHTDRPLRVRHRLGPAGQLVEDLHNCWALVTFMSNVAVDALLAGVPVICTGPAAARRMGGTLAGVESPSRPADRAAFFWNLAANQWTLAEIESGAAWAALESAAVPEGMT